MSYAKCTKLGPEAGLTPRPAHLGLFPPQHRLCILLHFIFFPFSFLFFPFHFFFFFEELASCTFCFSRMFPRGRFKECIQNWIFWGERRCRTAFSELRLVGLTAELGGKPGNLLETLCNLSTFSLCIYSSFPLLPPSCPLLHLAGSRFSRH